MFHEDDISPDHLEGFSHWVSRKGGYPLPAGQEHPFARALDRRADTPDGLSDILRLLGMRSIGTGDVAALYGAAARTLVERAYQNIAGTVDPIVRNIVAKDFKPVELGQIDVANEPATADQFFGAQDIKYSTIEWSESVITGQVKTYGFHGIHGRALPVAEGIKMVRPDLTVFVNTGDGDCCSIGAAHWIHAIRYNMNLTVFLHDNQIYGLTKKQASPTSPIGTKSNTTPRGSYLDALNPLSVTLGVANASFVAQAVDWIPESLFEIVKAAYHHQGLSFVRILQRCPEWLPKSLDPWMQDPDKIALLHHENALHLSAGLSKTYKNQWLHDPLDMNRAREIASSEDVIPVGILYQNRDIPRYEETRQTGVLRTLETVRKGFEAELDKYTV